MRKYLIRSRESGGEGGKGGCRGKGRLVRTFGWKGREWGADKVKEEGVRGGGGGEKANPSHLIGYLTTSVINVGQSQCPQDKVPDGADLNFWRGMKAQHPTWLILRRNPIHFAGKKKRLWVGKEEIIKLNFHKFAFLCVGFAVSFKSFDFHVWYYLSKNKVTTPLARTTMSMDPC